MQNICMYMNIYIHMYIQTEQSVQSNSLSIITINTQTTDNNNDNHAMLNDHNNLQQLPRQDSRGSRGRGSKQNVLNNLTALKLS